MYITLKNRGAENLRIFYSIIHVCVVCSFAVHYYNIHKSAPNKL